jgi:hypothetical protein
MSEGGELEVREVPRPSGLCTLSLELEALILCLLSSEREQRGTAAQLARKALALSNAAGEAADMPIDPVMPPELAAAKRGPSSDGADDELLSGSESDSDEPTGSSSTDSTRAGRRRRREDVEPDWLAPALVALSGGLVFALVLLLVFLLTRAREPAPRWDDRHQQVAQFVPDAGVADDALSTVQDADRRVGPWMLALGRPMPSKPHPDQRRPPCERGEKEINGGCWVGPLRDEVPPCGAKMFEYEGGCYFASFTGPKTPTSKEP